MLRTGVTATLVALMLALPACAARLRVDSDPPGAEILVDDQPMGRTPNVVRVDPGTHRVKVRVRDYGDSETMSVNVQKSTSRIVLSIILPIPMAIIYGFKGWSVADPVWLKFDAPKPSR